jgi:predicted AAA+ superfamily ATPase
MSSEISTYLTGRYVTFRIFTLSFEEYLTFKKQYGEIDDIHKELVKYEIGDNYPKYLLMTDDFAGENYQGIKTMHVADFLLSNEY